ncbi:HlyD family secretion protein [Arhodomonas aquaeolei]|uniref:HlyD family secretion protein n=1 Tax=Arhodomonas aquaeolei TaxID=2369 RepID=UPI002169D94B|nr:HlyD family secretion protein [Arhodomonas aquaeolei]MCS4505416.1 HlyD family secretion protein [Arhodomonas aquaeolei]
MRGIKLVVFGVVLAAVIAAGVVYGIEWYRVGRFIEETDNAQVAADSVAIQPEINARVVDVPVAENQVVDKGQLLVRLEDKDLTTQRDRAAAQLRQARANLQATERQITLQQARIEQAAARVDSAKAETERSRLDLQRAKSLEKRSYSSRQELDNAQAAYRVARSEGQAARATLTAEKRQLPVLKAQRDQASAAVADAEAALAYARHQLDKTRIVAPAAGVVGDVTVEAGSMAQPARTLLHVVPLPEVYVVANFKETQIARMEIGQPVDIHVDAYPDRVFKGRVASLSPATGAQFSLLPQDNATGNFNKIVQKVPVRIRVTEPPERLALLRPGLSVVPEVDTRETGEGRVYRNQDRNPLADADQGERSGPDDNRDGGRP